MIYFLKKLWLRICNRALPHVPFVCYLPNIFSACMPSSLSVSVYISVSVCYLFVYLLSACPHNACFSVWCLDACWLPFCRVFAIFQMSACLPYAVSLSDVYVQSAGSLLTVCYLFVSLLSVYSLSNYLSVAVYQNVITNSEFKHFIKSIHRLVI